MSRNPRRNLHFEKDRVTPLSMFRNGLEFFAAGMVSDDALGDEVGYELHAPIPVTFLIARSMELTMKSFLLQRGESLETIKKVGHDLLEGLRLSDGHGLEALAKVSGEDRKLVGVVDSLYSNKEFEYPVIGAKTFPVFGPLQSFAGRLLYAVSLEIKQAPEMIARTKAGEQLRRLGT